MPTARPQRRPSTRPADPGELPLRAFVSSVMTPDLQWARDEVVTALRGVTFVRPWAFERTPASSEKRDDAYLRHVREAVFVVWLVGAETTEPVEREIREAVAAQRRLIIFLLPTPKRSTATEALLEEVSAYARYRRLADEQQTTLRSELRLAFDDEIVRALRDQPGLGREALLEERARASRAHMIERWLAAGVEPDVARALGDDVTVGAPPTSCFPNESRRVVVLSAPLGAGKSLAGHRMHQTAVARFALQASAPIPVWLAAGDAPSTELGARIRDAAEGLGDPRTQGADIVIDGLDEAGPSRAEELLGAARRLVETWPSTNVVVTTRPLPGVGNREELETLGDMSDDAARQLVGRIAGLGITQGWAAGWPEPLRAAIRWPLFAVLLGAALRDSSSGPAPQSRAELLAVLARAAKNRAGTDVEPLLRALAVKSIDRGGSAVPVSEAGTPAEVDALVATRLVVHDGETLRFPLIVFAQWFAGVAIAEGEVVVGDLAERTHLDRWLYPIAMVCAIYPHDAVSKILAPLARAVPAFASRVVKESLGRWAMTEVAAPPSLDAARRVRHATEAWTTGIGPLSRLVAPLKQDGTLASLGAHTAGAGLTLVWYRGTDRNDVFELPGGFNALQPGPGWGPGMFARPGHQSAWAWRWSLEAVSNPLSQLLQKRLLPITGGPLFDAALYEVVALLAGHGSLARGTFALVEIRKRVPSTGDLVFAGNRVLPIAVVRDELDRLIAAGIGELASPFATPDLEQRGGGWVWEPYSPDRLVERVITVYEAAMNGYVRYVDDYFPRLADRMSTAVTLPAVLRGILQPNASANSFVGPTLWWYFDPLPDGSTSRVEISLADKPVLGWDDAAAEQAWTRLRTLRPTAAEWVTHHQSNTALDVFNVYSANEIAYSWLWHDLSDIGWVSGLLGGRPWNVPPILAP